MTRSCQGADRITRKTNPDDGTENGVKGAGYWETDALGFHHRDLKGTEGFKKYQAR